MEIISQNKIKSDLADNIVMRTYEVYAYDTNIRNYTLLLDNLKDLEWPAEWESLRTLDPHQAATMVAVEEVELLSNLQQKDRLAALLASENVERTKSKSILDVLDAQLTGPDRDTFLEAAVAKYNALTGN